MHHPLSLSFKIAALAPQLYVRDANGTELLLEGSMDEAMETAVLLSILIMILHERRRG